MLPPFMLLPVTNVPRKSRSRLRLVTFVTIFSSCPMCESLRTPGHIWRRRPRKSPIGTSKLVPTHPTWDYAYCNRKYENCCRLSRGRGESTSPTQRRSKRDHAKNPIFEQHLFNRINTPCNHPSAYSTWIDMVRVKASITVAIRIEQVLVLLLHRDKHPSSTAKCSSRPGRIIAASKILHKLHHHSLLNGRSGVQ